MLKITSQSDFDSYLARVQYKADCHAHNVKDIISILAEEVLKIYPLQSGIDVRTYNNNTGNIAWVNGSKGRVAFTYQESDDKYGEKSKIILRNKTLNGRERTHFVNGMSRSEIRSALELNL